MGWLSILEVQCWCERESDIVEVSLQYQDLGRLRGVCPTRDIGGGHQAKCAASNCWGGVGGREFHMCKVSIIAA